MGLFLLGPASQVSATAGTTGAIDCPQNIKKGVGFYFDLTSLTDAGEYIIVPSVTTLGLSNVTFTATSTSMEKGPYVATGTGAVTFVLYGASSGVASGSALDQVEATVTTIGSGIVDTSVFTDLLSFFLPIIIVVGLVLAFKFRDKIMDLRK